MLHTLLLLNQRNHPQYICLVSITWYYIDEHQLPSITTCSSTKVWAATELGQTCLLLPMVQSARPDRVATPPRRPQVWGVLRVLGGLSGLQIHGHGLLELTRCHHHEMSSQRLVHITLVWLSASGYRPMMLLFLPPHQVTLWLWYDTIIDSCDIYRVYTKEFKAHEILILLSYRCHDYVSILLSRPGTVRSVSIELREESTRATRGASTAE